MFSVGDSVTVAVYLIHSMFRNTSLPMRPRLNRFSTLAITPSRTSASSKKHRSVNSLGLSVVPKK